MTSPTLKERELTTTSKFINVDHALVTHQLVFDTALLLVGGTFEVAWLQEGQRKS